MKYLAAIALVLIPLGLYAEGNLKIVVSGIDPSKGETLAVALYDSERAYEAEESLSRDRTTLGENEEIVEFVFSGVPEGPLMVIGIQDADGDLEMDTGLFGIPKEGFFCSQNASVPKWDRCVFPFTGGNAVIRLEMIYW